MEQKRQHESKLRLVNGGQLATQVEHIEEANRESLINRLPSVLQTTLDINELVSLFHTQIQQILPFDSYHFTHEQAGCVFETQSKCHHRSHYTLEMNNVYLGDITITRRHAFNEDELSLFESLLCTLVYPLRNSLLYKTALDSSLHDNLTGLKNRAAFDESLNREIELAARQSTPLSLVVMDIDHFKKINDNYGHSAGDKALKQLADTIKSTMRGCDMAFRYGGEEFTLVLSNTDQDAAKIVANRLRVAVSQLFCEDAKHTFGYTVSLGVAQWQENETGSLLFDRADKALYEAKQAGRNAVFCA